MTFIFKNLNSSKLKMGVNYTIYQYQNENNKHEENTMNMYHKNSRNNFKIFQKKILHLILQIIKLI